MDNPPRKPEQRPRMPSRPLLDREEHVSLMPESDREIILRRLAEVNDHLTIKIDKLARDADERLSLLEKQALAERETALAVRELTSSVNTLNAANRAQDLDIGALTHKVELATRPAVQATASAAGSAEGTLAGADAGKRAGRLWGIVLAIVGVVVSQVINHCEQQILNYNDATAPAATARK